MTQISLENQIDALDKKFTGFKDFVYSVKSLCFSYKSSGNVVNFMWQERSLHFYQSANYYTCDLYARHLFINGSFDLSIEAAYKYFIVDGYELCKRKPMRAQL